MPDPLSATALLGVAATAIAKGAGKVLGAGAVSTWKQSHYVRTASGVALEATGLLHRGKPGVGLALGAWAESASFDALLLDAERRDAASLSEDRVVTSFRENGGAGWNASEAAELTTDFLTHFLDELAKGPDGQVLARRLAEARADQASTERRQILTTAEAAQRAAEAGQRAAERTDLSTRDLGPRMDALREALESTAPDGRLPSLLKSAVQDGIFDEIGRYLAEDDPAEALALADRFSDRVSAALSDDSRYADALRPYHQRLLFAAANAASRLMDADTARARAVSALALGPVEEPLFRQAVDATFNAALTDDLRRLTTQIPTGTPESARAEAMLAYREADWDTAARQLGALGDPSFLSLRAAAETARLDPVDPDAVQTAASLLDECEASASRDALETARLSVDLLDRVLRANTPSAFSRRPLVEAVQRRALAAVEATPAGTLLRAHALGILEAAGRTLLDGLLSQDASQGLDALPEEILSRVVFVLPPTALEIAVAVSAGRITPSQAARLTAQNHVVDENLDAAAATLREALFQTPEPSDRVAVVEMLVATLRADGKHDEANTLLTATPIPEADRWRIAQRDDRPLDVAAAALLAPDPRVLRTVAGWLLRTTLPRGRDDEGDVVRPTLATTDDADVRPSHWTERLVEALPSRSSRALHAEALLHDGEFADLLDAVADLEEAEAPRPAELRAFALQGLGKLGDAAREMSKAARAFPDLERVALNASAIWLELRKGREAIDLLEPFIARGTTTVGTLVNYATALHEARPGDRDAASQAFDLLEQAYAQAPSQRLATQAWLASRAAGRESEAGDYFEAMTADAEHVEIQTAEDAERILSQPLGGAFTAFSGDISVFLDVVASRTREEREATDRLNEVSTAHALAYADTFRASGHAWENWTRATQNAERRRDGEGFSVLADWPSSVHVFGRREPSPNGIYADLSAILTLGVLGRNAAAALLSAAAPVYVATGMLERLDGDIQRLQGDVAVAGSAGDVMAVERFEDTDAVVAYDQEIEEAAPDVPELGAARVDLGVAIHLGGQYVSDLEQAESAGEHTVGSASLLHTLHLDSHVEHAAAARAAAAHSGTFGGWETAPLLDALPPALVFDRHALAAWTASGLIDALPVPVRIGPWAWTQILNDVRQKEISMLAYERAKQTLDVLNEAIEAGWLREVDPVEPPVPAEGALAEGAPWERQESLEGHWREALRSVRTAAAHGLDLWADDRFYALLLWIGGPVIDGPATEAILDSLRDAGNLPVPVPTADLLARLARDGALPETEARRLAGLLFDQGYRPAHPLALADALDRFEVLAASPLRGRALAIASAVQAIPTYLPETIPLVKRQGFARVAAAEVAEQFVSLAWTHPDLNDAQRRVLADAFLGAVEAVFGEQSPISEAPRSDRTRLLFWRGLSSTLFAATFGDEDADLRDAALRWLGDAAAQRPDPYHDIVRLLEDNASSAVALTPGVERVADALAKTGHPDVDPREQHARAVGRFAFRALVPLLGSRLVDHLDPLLRRTVGTLAHLDRGARLDMQIGVLYNGRELTTTIPEEDDDAAAVNLIRRVAGGDHALADLVRATDLRFTYNRPPPEDWVEAGVPADAYVPVDVQVSLVTLLWVDAPDVHPAVVSQLLYQLARLDPPLALLLFDIRDGLLSEDDSERTAARDALALALLESGFYEIQRDLGHAVWRLREWPADRLARFLGWIGAGDAQRLAAIDSDIAGQVVTLGDIVVSQHHFFGRQLLTDTFSDEAFVLGAVGETLAGNTPPPIPDLAVWTANRCETAEGADDPFVAAYALRHVLLALRAGMDDPDTAAWTDSYLGTALAKLDPSAGPLARHLDLRRRLARSALQLAAFAAFGRHHLEAYEEEEDPLAEWLDRTWLLTSRFLTALPALYGDLARATAEAERAMHDLGLGTGAAWVQDAFDPFAFAGADDIGRTLTLAAMHSSLDPDAAEAPPWWSPDIERLVSDIAACDSDAPSNPDLQDRFGLGAPLRERPRAQAILERIGACRAQGSADPHDA